MLKYDFDSQKKATFLGFWNIKDTSTWPQLAENKEAILAHLFALPYDLSKALFSLINLSLESKHFSLKGNILKVSPEQIEEENLFLPEKMDMDYEALEKLDVLNFIAYEKSDPLKRHKKASWVWESWFARFLAEMRILAQGEGNNFHLLEVVRGDEKNEIAAESNKKKDEKKNFKISKDEKLILSHLQQNFILSNDADLSLLKKKLTSNLSSLLATLVKKKILIPIITLENVFKVNLFINPSLYQYQQANFLVNLPTSVEKNWQLASLHETVLMVDREIYEKVVGLQLPVLELKADKKIKAIVEEIIQKKSYASYIKLDFREKIDFILSEMSADYSLVLEKLITEIYDYQLNEKKSAEQIEQQLSELDLIFLLRSVYQKSFNKLLLLDEVYQVITDFNLLGLLHFNKNNFYLNEFLYLGQSSPNHAQKNAEKNTKAEPKTSASTDATSSKLIIDSDMSITVFKDVLDEPLLYYLSIFTHKKSHTYSWQFEIDYKLVNFAWFLNFTQDKIISFLQKYQNEAMLGEVKEYIKLFFENCSLFKKTELPSLKISSTINYHQIKYSLEKNSSSKENTKKENAKKWDVIFLDDRKMIIFLSYADYLAFLAENRDNQDKQSYKII